MKSSEPKTSLSNAPISIGVEAWTMPTIPSSGPSLSRHRPTGQEAKPPMVKPLFTARPTSDSPSQRMAGPQHMPTSQRFSQIIREKFRMLILLIMNL